MAHREALPPDAVDEMIEFVARTGDQDVQETLRAKSLAYRLRRVTHLLERDMRRELARHGVELTELEMLAALMRAPQGRLTAGELMTASQLTSGTVTHRITRVQERGWVRRDPDPDDRRSVLVSLTDAGRRRALDVMSVKTEVERDVLAVLDDDTVDDVNDALRRVLHHLEHP